MEIKSLTPNTKATLEKVKIVALGEIREFSRFGKPGKVCTHTIEDASGKCGLTLWNDDVNKYFEGDMLKLTDMWVKEWNDKISVSTGKDGSIERVQ